MRTHITKQYFTEALFRLLEKKKYNEITVVELVKVSGASKASFYRNYLNMDSIVEEYLENLCKDIIERYPITQNNMKKEVEGIFEGLMQYQRELTLLRDHQLLDKMNKYIYQATLSEINRLEVFHNEYQPYFFAGASIGLIDGWITNGFKDSPETMSEIFMLSLKGYM